MDELLLKFKIHHEDRFVFNVEEVLKYYRVDMWSTERYAIRFPDGKTFTVNEFARELLSMVRGIHAKDYDSVLISETKGFSGDNLVLIGLEVIAKKFKEEGM